MLLDGDARGWKPTVRRIPFDYEAIFEEFESSGYNNEAGPIGRLTVEIYRRARPMLSFLRWHKKHKPGSQLSDELVDEFLTNANLWEYSHKAYHLNMA